MSSIRGSRAVSQHDGTSTMFCCISSFSPVFVYRCIPTELCFIFVYIFISYFLFCGAPLHFEPYLYSLTWHHLNVIFYHSIYTNCRRLFSLSFFLELRFRNVLTFFFFMSVTLMLSDKRLQEKPHSVYSSGHVNTDNEAHPSLICFLFGWWLSLSLSKRLLCVNFVYNMELFCSFEQLLKGNTIFL